jgi:copper chaperone CopZ
MNAISLKTNLRCQACVKAIAPLLDAAPGIQSWSADVTVPEKWLRVQGATVTAAAVQQLLEQKGYRVLEDATPAVPAGVRRYAPLALIIAYILGAAALVEVAAGAFDAMRFMRHFMAGFFLVFSFFKMLDVRAFADAYRNYDVIAKRVPAYGFIYPFVELALGAAYLANWQPFAVNAATLAIMSISTVGVLQSVLAKRAIRCACLGTVFNLPMSAITLVEDLLMVAMAALMLVSFV